MSKEFVFIFMIFCHIIDDFVLQAPCLCNLKQRSWWEKNAPDEKYKNDYKVALIIHSLSWSFMIMLPIAIYYKLDIGTSFIIQMVGNAIIHGFVDDIKANKKLINLYQDQSIHVIQIILTFVRFVIGGFE
jgi:hypothetical protein